MSWSLHRIIVAETIWAISAEMSYFLAFGATIVGRS
jgi:hypothetical protein